MAETNVSLELYLEDESVCMRSVTFDGLPYCEKDLQYNNATNELIKSIEGGFLHSDILPLLRGYNEDKIRKSGIKCTIEDLRSKNQETKTVYLFSNPSEGHPNPKCSIGCSIQADSVNPHFDQQCIAES